MKSLTLAEFRELTKDLPGDAIIITPDNIDEAFSVRVKLGHVGLTSEGLYNFTEDGNEGPKEFRAIAFSELWSR